VKPADPLELRSLFICELKSQGSHGFFSRLLAHLLIRLLVVGPLPASVQAWAAFFPVSLLAPLVATASPGGEGAAAQGTQVPQDAWGNFRFPSELNADGDTVAAKNRFAFTGYLWDKETNLFFAKARFYDPEVGRFISQDSYLGQVDDPPSLHRYFYANDNPTRYVDPTGHDNELVQAAEQERARRAALAAKGQAGRSYTTDQGGGIVPADGPVSAPHGSRPGTTADSIDEIDLGRFDRETQKKLREGSPEAVARHNHDNHATTITQEQGTPDQRVAACAGDATCLAIARSRDTSLDAFSKVGKYGGKLSREALDLAPGAEAAKFAAGEDFEGNGVNRASMGAEALVVTVVAAAGGKLVYKVGEKIFHSFKAAKKHADEIVDSATHGHHTIPRAVRKSRTTGESLLPEHLREHPDIKGRPGNPNIWDIPADEHLGPGGVHSPKRTGGDFNARWKEELARLEEAKPNPKTWTPEDVLTIRNRLAKEFDIEKYRPQK